jgi:heme A synthase
MNKKAKKKAQKKTSSAGWVVRFLIWGAVAVFAVFALLDYKGHNDAEATYKAWMKVRNERVNADDEDFRLSELEALTQGNPNRTKPAKSNREGVRASKFVIYSWGGLFRNNSVEVYYTGLSDDPLILRILLPEGGE